MGTSIVVYIPLYKLIVSKRLRTKGDDLTQKAVSCSEVGRARFLLTSGAIDVWSISTGSYQFILPHRAMSSENDFRFVSQKKVSRFLRLFWFVVDSLSEIG